METALAARADLWPLLPSVEWAMSGWMDNELAERPAAHLSILEALRRALARFCEGQNELARFASDSASGS